jgi:AcrR family transcriptional regulator
VPSRREAVLNRIVDSLLSEGLADASLRSIAERVGTSHRMLIYYFGSRERLLVEAMALARERERSEALRDLARTDSRDLENVIRRQWARTLKRLEYLRLFYELFGIALGDAKAYSEFLEDTAHWVPLVREGLAARGASIAEAESFATLLLGAGRGLLLDLIATGDQARVEAGFEALVPLLASSPAIRRIRRL